jgi:hypothetical protein
MRGALPPIPPHVFVTCRKGTFLAVNFYKLLNKTPSMSVPKNNFENVSGFQLASIPVSALQLQQLHPVTLIADIPEAERSSCH